MSCFSSSDKMVMLQRCRSKFSSDPFGPISGTEITKLIDLVADQFQPRSPGRRATDKLDLVEICAQLLEAKESSAKLMDTAHALMEEIQAERKDHQITRAALTLAEALLNRERRFTAPLEAITQ